jgi:hypothetical protein
MFLAIILASGLSVGDGFYQCQASHRCIMDPCGLVTGFQEPHGGTAWTTGCNMSFGMGQVTTDPYHNSACAIAVAKACEDATP